MPSPPPSFSSSYLSRLILNLAQDSSLPARTLCILLAITSCLLYSYSASLSFSPPEGIFFTKQASSSENMHPSLKSIVLPATAAASSLLVQAAAAGAGQEEVDIKWHAPASTEVNNLGQVLDGKGVYGWVYDSSETPEGKYGVYNWCNMPHVRSDIYVKADEEKYELVYVELIHRHHKRTPYASNAFPVESYQWNCDDSYLHYYGEPDSLSPPAARAYRQGYTSHINPFVPSGWIGTCQFPQITEGGLGDSWLHGKDLYRVYGDKLGFLPKKQNRREWERKVKYRVSNNVITSQVAGMVINGMWGITDPYPLLSQAAGIDSLEPQYSCSVGSNLFSSIQSSSTPSWQQHLSRASSLYATLDNISGVPADDGGFHMSFDHYYDNLSARQCHARPLPCKLVNGQNSTTCVTQELADAVYRMGNWEYSRIYRDDSRSLAASATTYGVWVAELASHLRDVIDGKTEVIYYHNVAHDGSVSRLLSILQIDEMVWPGMGSEVVFELYKKKQPKTDPTSTVIAPGCSHNNCLRYMIQHQSACGQTSVPSECGNASQKASACACLGGPTATSSAGAGPVPTSSSLLDKYFIRVLFSGKVLKSSNPSLDVLDMIPVSTLLAYFDGLVGRDASLVKGKCSGSTPL